MLRISFFIVLSVLFGTGVACTEKSIKGECSSHADCDDGLICVDGRCTEPTTEMQDPVAPDDSDGDRVPDEEDNCPEVANSDQDDMDGDGIGDACDEDIDNDRVNNEDDNCPFVTNDDQGDIDEDGIGDFCDDDIDGDGILNEEDNCPEIPNLQQLDSDNDGKGDVCDDDFDGDGVVNAEDNCVTISNADQADADQDGIGDVCEEVGDRDNDGVLDPDDNCPDDFNPEQEDGDLDGPGDACDEPSLFRDDVTVNNDCDFQPPVSEFSPEEKWRWPQFEDGVTYPTKTQVMSTPMVANLTDDNGDGDVNELDIPEVIFISFDTYVEPEHAQDPVWHHPRDGVLRAVDGQTGLTVFSSDADGQFFSPVSNVAVGDLNDDGVPEIVALKANGNGLIAISADGTTYWDCSDLGSCFSTGSWFNWGAVSIANLDRSGSPEIIYGNRIFRADGSEWRILNSNGSLHDLTNDGSGDNFIKPDFTHRIGPLSFAVDLDGDTSNLELIAGRTIYGWDVVFDVYAVDTYRTDNIASAIANVVLGDYPEEQDGFPAVGNFDADSKLEMVLVAEEFVLLLDHNGTLLDAIHIPQAEGGGSFAGGSPTVADFDGDGYLEIGVAGETRYAVIDYFGGELSVLWEAPINEVSSSRTGSSVFDFDADGRAEVVYADERALHIYTFHDGNPPEGHDDCDEILCHWSKATSSFTAYEYPVIADVNRDGNAEIVVAANDFGREDDVDVEAGIVPTRGVIVFGDERDHWVPTRPIWNQHAYYISNVNDDGSIPVEQSTFLASNSFRQNQQGSVEAPDLRAPDLVPGASLSMSTCLPGMVVGIWVENQGALVVSAGVTVALYSGDPAESASQLMGTGQTTAPLEPGEAQFVVVALGPQWVASAEAFAMVDYSSIGGMHSECNEGNNVRSLGPLACTP